MAKHSKKQKPAPIAKRDKAKEAREIEYYGAVVNAWINTRMERDKSILTLSAGALGLLVTLITTVGASGPVEALFYLLAFLSFGASCWTAVMIFGRNADYLERLGKGEDCTDPRLAKLDRILKAGFFTGVVSAALLGGTSYLSHRSGGTSDMTEKKGSSQTGAPLKKSLDQLNQLRPGKQSPKTGSVDGLNKLKPGDTGTSNNEQPGTKTTK
jgi:hypothetical protein